MVSDVVVSTGDATSVAPIALLSCPYFRITQRI